MPEPSGWRSRLADRRRTLSDHWPHCLALGVFALALWAQPIGAMAGAFFDDGIYLTLAEALAMGEGYRNVHLPGAPPAVHHPLLYSLALSVLWRLWPVFPDNMTLFQLFDAAALAGAAWIIAAHAKRWSSPAFAQYIALPLGFMAFPLLNLVGMRFAEPLYLLLWAGAVAVADRDATTYRSAVVAGALAGLATLARSVGITIVAGVALALAIRKRPRQAISAAVAGAVTTAPWLVWTALQGSRIDTRIAANYGSYLQVAQQSGLSGLVPGDYLGALTPLAELLLPRLPSMLWHPAAVAIGAIAVWGGVVVAKRAPALVASLGAYLLLASFWFWFPDRFVWIILPWLLVLLVAGAAEAWRRGLALRVPVVVLMLACGVGYGWREAMSLARRGFDAPTRRISAPFTILAPAIRAETPPDAVIATDREALVWLYTGRRAVPSYLFQWTARGVGVPLSREETLSYLCEAGATHVAVSGPGSPAAPLVDELAARADSTLEPLFRFAGGPALFRFRCPH